MSGRRGYRRTFRQERAASSTRARMEGIGHSDGIRATGQSSTWWGRRWLEALRKIHEDHPGRLVRGRALAQGGRVRELSIGPGGVRAQVSEPRGHSRMVSMTLEPSTPAQRARVLEALCSEARFTAQLGQGELDADMPEDVLESLYPRMGSDLSLHCGCSDRPHPCRHISALYHVIAEALDRDGLLLFAMRGWDRHLLLGAAATVEAQKGTVSGIEHPQDPWSRFIGVGTQLPTMDFHMEVPGTDAWLLTHLGPLPGASELSLWRDMLVESYRRSSREALRLALGEEAAAALRAPAVAPLPEDASAPRAIRSLRRTDDGGDPAAAPRPRAASVVSLRPGGSTPAPRSTSAGIGPGSSWALDGRALAAAHAGNVEGAAPGSPAARDRIVQLLRQRGPMGISQLQDFVELDRDGLRDMLRDMVTQGQLLTSGRTRGTLYHAPTDVA